MLALRLPPDIEKRLDDLAKKGPAGRRAIMPARRSLSIWRIWKISPLPMSACGEARRDVELGGGQGPAV